MLFAKIIQKNQINYQQENFCIFQNLKCDDSFIIVMIKPLLNVSQENGIIMFLHNVKFWVSNCAEFNFKFRSFRNLYQIVATLFITKC